MPSSIIVIGRKELFSFAERYAAVKLRDYGSLADGHVLCLLFNQIFPQYATRPAPPETHSPSQRMQLNWETLYRHLVRVAIPVTLLDPVALAEGHTEAGFAALVLFYFLFHLTKRMDFSAEFAVDLPEDLTAFLQSADCVGSLLMGEAVSWESVPDALGDQVRQLAAFHTTPAEVHAQEEDAVRQLRARFQSRTAPASRATGTQPRSSSSLPPPRDITQHVWAGPSSTCQDDSEEAAQDAMDGSDERADTNDSVPPSTSSSRASSRSLAEDVPPSDAHYFDVAEKLREEKRALIRHAADLSHTLTAVRASHRQLEAERDALLEVEAEREAELAILREWQSHTPVRAAQRGIGRRSDGGAARPIATQAVEALLDDVMDPETGDVVDVHERANMLHCLLLEHLREAPRPREQGQRWLWSLLSAYHTLETRLLTAVDVIEDLERAAHAQPPPPQPSVVGTSTTSSTRSAAAAEVDDAAHAWQQLVEDCHDKLAAAHTREHALAQNVADVTQSLRTTAQCAARRDALWRSLCTALHTAEQASFTMAGSDSEGEVAQLLHRRDEAYEAIDGFTSALLQDALPTPEASPASRTAPAASPCLATTLQLDLLRDENALLRQQCHALRSHEGLNTKAEAASPDSDHEQGLSPSTQMELSVEGRLARQQRYEETTQRPYRSSAAAAHRLPVTPSPPSSHRGSAADTSGLKDVSPYAKSLLKLLTEASSCSPNAKRRALSTCNS